MAPAGLNMTKKRKCCTKNFPVIVLFASNHIAVVACSFSYLSVNTCLLLYREANLQVGKWFIVATGRAGGVDTPVCECDNSRMR